MADTHIDIHAPLLSQPSSASEEQGEVEERNDADDNGQQEEEEEEEEEEGEEKQEEGHYEREDDEDNLQHSISASDDLHSHHNLQERALPADRSDEPCLESLDYDPIHSIVAAKSRKEPQIRRLYGYTGVTFTKWTLTILIGILTGCSAYIIAYFQEQIITYKKTWTQNTISQSLLLAFIGYAGFGVLLVIVSTCLVLYCAPAAAGGGVTLVMAYLNGNEIPDLLRLRTLMTKIFGTICTISSGMPMGQEGPMVHIGAAVASTLTWMHCGFSSNKDQKPSRSRRCCSKLDLQPLPVTIYNDKDRREFISAGAAAGLAAAFGSPVGGVLYSLEEASSFWSRKVMWRSLVCTTFATMVLSWLHEKEFSFALPGTLSFHGLQPEFVLRDLPLFILTSIGAGILGALVNISHEWMTYIRPSSSHRFARIIEACLITIFCVAVIFVLPLFLGQCKEIPESDTESDSVEFWFAYNCQQDSTLLYNDLATLFFSVPHRTIKHLLQLGNSSASYFSVTSLGVHACSFFIFFVLSYGVAAPGGIFMPSMMAGSSFGAFLGTVFKNLFPRSTLSLPSLNCVVIIVEGTGGIEFLLPIILAIVISNWVTHHIHQAGAYEADLEKSGNIHFLHSEPPHELLSLTAADIMAQHVIGFEEIVSVTEVIRVLKSVRHNGFPVFRCASAEETGRGKLVGLILRHQLMVLLEERAFIRVNPRILRHPGLVKHSQIGKKAMQDLKRLERAMQVYHHHHNAHRRGLSSMPEALDKLQINEITSEPIQAPENTAEGSDDTQILALDLRPFMNRAPLTVRAECSAQRVYVIFRTLGLRHLCVTDANNKVIGMITRKDLSRAHMEHKLMERKGTLTMSDFDMQSFYDKDDKTSLNILYSLP